MSDELSGLPEAGDVPTEPVARRPLHEGAADRLRDMIIEGRLLPGDRIPEQAICDRLGVSRTPLREALKMLAAEGLVVLQPNRGATVANPSPDEVDQTFRVIGAMEALAGELACENVDEADIAEIRAMHYQMVLHRTRQELPDYFKLNQQIHQRIVEASGNAVLVETYRRLVGRIRRHRYIANLSAKRWDEAIREHEEMLGALDERDGARLSTILRRHLDNKRAAAHAAASTD